jgi:hypothetical protein
LSATPRGKTPAMQSWSYVALCLVVPLVWGLASARAFDWWQARRPSRPAPMPDDTSVDMYHI